MAITRKAQKAKLKEILETLSFDFSLGVGDPDVKNITVSDNFINSADEFPYFFIVGLDTDPTIQSTGRRKEVKQYQIKATFPLDEDNPYKFESAMNDIEELLKDELNLRVNHAFSGIWEEMKIINIVYPWSGDQITFLDNQIFLTFVIETRAKEVYQF